jgi:hypothetical protein
MKLVWYLLGFSLVGCATHEPSPTPTAEVGVFFGGQVQKLSRVEVSTVKPPKIGFRVEFPGRADDGDARPEISYELVRPGPSGRRVTHKGKLLLAEGQTQLDHLLPFDAGYKLGVWNVRVVHGEHLLADRAIYLVPARSSSSP